MKSPRRGSVLINDVWISPTRRPVDLGAVNRLAQSIREIGLLTPITVRTAAKVIDPELGEINDVTALVAGRHRLEAVRSLGLDRVDCFFSDFDDIHAELAEIDENLMRGTLSPAQEAVAISRRKAIYEELHPQTKSGVAQAVGMNKALGRGDVDDNLSFTSATADATGKDKRTVERAAARGEKVCTRALAMIRGTFLDTGTYLDAIKKITDSDDQVAKVQGDLSAGKPERKSRLAAPIKEVPQEKDAAEIEAEQKRSLMNAWNKASEEVRQWFREEVADASIMDTRYGSAA